MLLDSDDVLAPDAVRTLLATAVSEQAEVTAGVCVRRELPAGTDTPWQRDLFPAVGAPPRRYDGIDARPEFLRDTLCVNKLYLRDFLDKHRVRFAEGAVHYEDFVFTARLYAARPRLVAVGETVYLWHVRREAGRQSISLRRDEVRNWQDRVDAHAEAIRILDESGAPGLADAARTKFIDHDLRMYVRELRQKPAAYRAAWWRIARTHLAGFGPAPAAAASPAGRWLSDLLLARPEPVDGAELARACELAASPRGSPRPTSPTTTAARCSPRAYRSPASTPCRPAGCRWPSTVPCGSARSASSGCACTTRTGWCRPPGRSTPNWSSAPGSARR